MEKHAEHELHETVIRDHIQETAGQMLTYIKEVVALENGERAEVVADKYSNFLTMP